MKEHETEYDSVTRWRVFNSFGEMVKLDDTAEKDVSWYTHAAYFSGDFTKNRLLLVLQVDLK